MKTKEKAKIECPICGATIVHRRTDDGFESHRINNDGTVETLASNSHGCDEFMCSANADHELPAELQDRCMDIISEYCCP
jgi:hypothetical protein